MRALFASVIGTIGLRHSPWLLNMTTPDAVEGGMMACAAATAVQTAPRLFCPVDSMTEPTRTVASWLMLPDLSIRKMRLMFVLSTAAVGSPPLALRESTEEAPPLLGGGSSLGEGSSDIL
jgi:hypothetical protein